MLLSNGKGNNCNNYDNCIDVVLGGQLGDEGKGRLIDILAGKYSIVARCNSGGNAGHKVVINNTTYAFHLVPSGMLNSNVIGIIGNGCVGLQVSCSYLIL